MYLRTPLIAALLAGSSTVLASIVRINALGDSITGSPGCWRALLWQKLQAAGVTNTDFVGTLSAQGCGFTYDGENDGHGGFLATGIVSANQLPGWLAISLPDIVMMQLGTNDVWSGLSTATILAAYTTLVGQMRAQNPSMVILVAKITAMNPPSCTTCYQGVIDLDAAVPAWAASISTTASPVTVVDCWTGYDPAVDTADGVHPNDAGNIVLANDWFAPLSSAIIKVGGRVAATSSTASTIASTTKTSVATTTSKSSSTVTSSSSSKITSSTLITSSTKTTVSSTTSKTSSSTASANTATQTLYGQCGGVQYTGPSVCVGSTCTCYSIYYCQCI